MEEYYTIKQIAIVLKVHPLTVRRYIREGKLKASRVGGNIRISLNDLRNFTQTFVPQARQQRNQTISVTHEFSFADPIFQLKAKGLRVSEIEND